MSDDATHYVGDGCQPPHPEPGMTGERRFSSIGSFEGPPDLSTWTVAAVPAAPGEPTVGARNKLLRLCEVLADCVEALAGHRKAGTSTVETEVALAGHVQDLAELGVTLPGVDVVPDWSEDGVDGWYVSDLDVELDVSSRVGGPEVKLGGEAMELSAARRLRDVLDAVVRRGEQQQGGQR